MRQPSVLFGVRGPTVGAIEQQGGAGDRRPQRLYVRPRQVEDGTDVQIIVELPATAAVLVAIDPLHGQMTRLFGGKIAILGHHPGEPIVERRIAFWNLPRRLPLVIDQLAEETGRAT